MIKENADVNKGGGIFGSPLHLAIVRLKVSIIESLIKSNAHLDKQDSDGNTPLHLIMTIFSKNPDRCAYILDLLVYNGAQVNKFNNDNWAPIHTALRKGQESAIKAIITINRKIKNHSLTTMNTKRDAFNLNLQCGA